MLSGVQSDSYNSEELLVLNFHFPRGLGQQGELTQCVPRRLTDQELPRSGPPTV